ncbi:DHH family phosphoesterase [Abyssisolibacter fermentans]|uniref:DHH family phosphoesterase n=1 Tax=Abyssisolibacter fermentans TaxID=1766203 RepID=UPI00082DF4E5|nr:DHH family phosphoesterase [Abyssisolibacter fermentans]
MSNKFNVKDLIVDTKIYLLIIGLLTCILAFYEPKITVIMLFILGYLIYYYKKNIHLRKLEWTSYIQKLTDDFDYATRDSLFNLPLPLVILSKEGSILWYNPKFMDIIEQKHFLGENIKQIIPNISIDDVLNLEKMSSTEASIGKRDYKILYNVVNTSEETNTNNANYIIMLYLVDNTSFSILKQKYLDEKTSVCLIEVDNYDEVRKKTESSRVPVVFAEVDKILNEFAKSIDGFIRKYEQDKYIIVFENRFLKILEDAKFDVLDNIRSIDQGNEMPITLSIGVGVFGKNPAQMYEYARAAIDIALGRGGDQAVIKKIERLSFYGGKSKAVEKRTKVRARVISHALRQLIDQSDKVFIMGHKNGDMDSFGAAIGIANAVRSRGKKAYIVLDDVNPQIKNIYNRLYNEKPDYFDDVITSSQSYLKATEDSLCVVVDIHRPKSTEAPKLLEIIGKVVLIDHHRRGVEFIDNPILTYLEPYASSSCELVTEILAYMDNKIHLDKFEAEALLAGIAVDTKNFTFKTGVRTFEAASLLRRYGADTTSVKQLFQDDLETFIMKADVVKRARIINNEIAISSFDEDVDDYILIAAQAADDLLNINGITTSFVLAIKDNKIHISGRSLGKINVQLVLEKLGGGGHLAVAGAQLYDVTLNQAEALVEKAVTEYLEEGEE